MKARFFTLLALIFISTGCEKPEDEFCWQVVDAFGNDVQQLCGKTERQMKEDFADPCSYYKVGENFCWYIEGTIFIKNKPEVYVHRFTICFGYTNAVKVDCDYCQKWYTREKHTYKPAGTFHFSQIKVQQYCGDTAQTLFQGREIILRETTDSLIIVQFSNNGIF